VPDPSAAASEEPEAEEWSAESGSHAAEPDEPVADEVPDPSAAASEDPEPDTEPEPEPDPAPDPTAQVSPAAPSGGPVDINSASYEDLRGLGLSVTQTGRVLAFREREGSFKSLDELDSITGFPRGFLDDLKTHLSI